MGWNVSQSASIDGKVVLKYPAPFGTPLKSVVLDATDVASWPAPTDRFTRFVVPAGTILRYSATNPDQVVKYDGTGDIAGILSSPIDMLVNATDGDEQAAVWFTGVVFATESIVDFTTYASDLVSALPTCLFE